MNFGGDVGQIQRFFHGGIATADYRNFLIAIEETVTGGAGGNAFAFEGVFRRHAQVTGGRAGGDDQRIAGVFTTVAKQAERTVLQSTLLM